MTETNVSPASNWERSLRAVKGFVNANNRMPRKTASSESAERRLSEWSAKQRAAKRRNTLSADRVAILESIPGWLWGMNGGATSSAAPNPSSSVRLVQRADEVVDFFPNESA